jgi:hypothetical protein
MRLTNLAVMLEPFTMPCSRLFAQHCKILTIVLSQPTLA